MLSEIIFKIIQKFSFIKQNRFYDFCKKVLFPFLTINISKLFKDNIDEKLIVMGAFGGGAFVDNTKYLFKFLNERSDYKLVWITRFEHIAEKLRKEGYIVVSTFSFKAIKVLRRAKFIFMTHGYMDLLPVKFSRKTTKILTFHATAVKRIDVNIKTDFIYNGWGDIFRLNLKNDQYIDYVLTPSGNKIEHNILSSQLLISPEKILDLGYPRNDIYFKKDQKLIKDLRKYYKIPDNISRIILYAPTFRRDRTFNIPISHAQLNSLNALLKESKSLFLIKAHMVAEKIDFKEYNTIKLVDKASDIQELAIISDILITDYSSIQIDYLLTLNPIILFPYDLDEYIKTKGLNYDLKEIAGGPMVFNAEELIDALRNIDDIDVKYKEKRIMLRDRFNKYLDNKSTERVLRFFNIKFE